MARRVAGWQIERVPGPQETSSPSAPSRRGLIQWPREKKVTPLPTPNALRAFDLVRGYPWGCCRFLKIRANAPRAFGRAPRLRPVSEDSNPPGCEHQIHPPGCEHHQLLPIFEDSKDRRRVRIIRRRWRCVQQVCVCVLEPRRLANPRLPRATRVVVRAARRLTLPAASSNCRCCCA